MVSTVRMGIIRAEATFGHPVYYAMYCALIIPLALYVWQNEKNAWNSCVLGLNVIAAFLTESRGTIVVLLALFLVYVIIADKKTRNRILTAVCAIACVAVLVSFVVPTVAQQFSNIIKSVMIAFGDSSETIENFGGNSSTGLESRMIQLSGITWMLMHNAIFGLGASCHTRGKLSYYILHERERKALICFSALERQEEKLSEEKAEIVKQRVALYEQYANGNISKEEFIRQRDAYRVQEDDKMEQIQMLRTEKDQIFLPVRKDADNLQTVVSAAEEAGDVMHLSQNVVETFIDRIEVFNDERVKIRFTFEDALNSYEEK